MKKERRRAAFRERVTAATKEQRYVHQTRSLLFRLSCFLARGSLRQSRAPAQVHWHTPICSSKSASRAKAYTATKSVRKAKFQPLRRLLTNTKPTVYGTITKEMFTLYFHFLKFWTSLNSREISLCHFYFRTCFCKDQTFQRGICNEKVAFKLMKSLSCINSLKTSSCLWHTTKECLFLGKLFCLFHMIMKQRFTFINGLGSVGCSINKALKNKQIGFKYIRTVFIY